MNLVFEDGTSSKFWNASVDGTALTTKWGRIGTTGQAQTKTFESEAAATAAYEKLVGEKRKKGYVEAGEAAKLPASAPKTSLPEIRPMLAEEINAERDLMRYVEDDGWVFQAKLDGHRVMLHVNRGEVTILGRGGQDSQHAPRFAQTAYKDVGRLSDCVLDGELVGDEYWIFDLPFHADKAITTASPYAERLAALERVFAEWAPGDRYRLLRTARTVEEKAQLALDVRKAGGEGVMVKDLSARYQPGKRTRSNLKAKNVTDADFVVTQVGYEGRNNYCLGLYRDGELVEVGRCSANGKVVCAVNDIVTVRFLYVGSNGRLYQPRLVSGPRRDKSAAECDWRQIQHKHVNKVVID